MSDLFPVEHRNLLGALIVLTFGLGAMAGSVLGFPRLMGTIFFTGYFLVVPLVAVLGDSLSIVADKDVSMWRATGQEFAKGRHLADEADVEPDDPVEELRERYVDGEIDEAEFERRLDRLLDSERVEATTDERGHTAALE